jgi:2-(1,2-epoxy-1,2-dihydrophenyl)acetyl-CoA isomerase
MTNAPVDTDAVTLTIDAGVATLTLNRPDKRNAVNMDMHRGMAAALRAVQRDSSVRVLVLTGAGTAFCAGQDLAELAVGRASGLRVDDHVRTTFNRTIMALQQLRMPVVAAVNGVAAGAGMSLALAADVRVASSDASFTLAFHRIGLVPDTGATWLLPQLIGPARTLELVYTDRTLDAAAAHAWGLVNEVVARADLDERVTQLGASIAALPPTAISLTRRAVHRAATSTLEDALEYEAQLQQHVATSSEHTAAVEAFFARRAGA